MKHVISAGVFVVLFTAVVGAAGSSSVNFTSVDYTDVFCGNPLPMLRQDEPVVRPPQFGPATVDVGISSFAFTPPNVTINAGDTVRWTNNGGAHTTTSSTAVWNSGVLSVGQMFSFTFNTPGEYSYICSIHPSMMGNVSVSGASSTPTNTPTSTPTSTPTNTATPTPTASGTPLVSGVVTYGNAISGPPPPRFVSSVLLSGVGSPNISALTDGFGAYTLTGFGAGSYTVTPTKVGGVNSITSFDAAKIAQHVSGSALLTGNALLAADTSNNGQVTSFDAAKIAQYVTGGTIVPPNVTGTWRFIPVSRTYTSVTDSITGENYTALLMGEVSGNWANTTPTSTPTNTPTVAPTPTATNTPTATPTPQLAVLYDQLGGPGNWGWFNSQTIFDSYYSDMNENGFYAVATHFNLGLSSPFRITGMEFAPDYFVDNTGKPLPLTDSILDLCKIRVWNTTNGGFQADASLGSLYNISPGAFSSGSRTVPVGTQPGGTPVYVVGWNDLDISLPSGSIQISVQCPVNASATHVFATYKSAFAVTDTTLGATRTTGGSQQNFTYSNAALAVKIVGYNN